MKINFNSTSRDTASVKVMSNFYSTQDTSFTRLKHMLVQNYEKERLGLNSSAIKAVDPRESMQSNHSFFETRNFHI